MDVVEPVLAYGSGDIVLENRRPLAFHHELRGVDRYATLRMLEPVEEIQHRRDHVGWRRLPALDALDCELHFSRFGVRQQILEDGTRRVIARLHPILEGVAPYR